MPNQIAAHRRRTVYEEEKVNWEAMQATAKYNGISVSEVIRIATRQMCEILGENPKIRFITPIFEKATARLPINKERETRVRIFCPECQGIHMISESSMGEKKKCKDCNYLFVIQESLKKRRVSRK